MSKHRSLAIGDILPDSWIQALQEFVSTLESNVNITKASSTSIQQVAGTGSAQVSIGVGGLWRYISSTTTASMPGGATTGTYDIYAIASGNAFSNVPVPDTDTTDYTFGLKIVTGGGAAPTGTYNTQPIVATRKIATLDYDAGAGIQRITQIGGGSGNAVSFTQTVGDGTTTTIAINHNLGTRDLSVTVRDTVTSEMVLANVLFTSTNTVTVRFNPAPTTGQYQVIVMGVR